MLNPNERPPAPPTQRLIAAEAGVSRETVSHILGGGSGYRYSEETRNKVRETAARLGYHPNRLARAIRKGRSNLIGVIQAGGNLELARQAHLHLAEEIHRHGFDSLSVDISRNSDRIVDSMIQSRVEGVILSLTSNEFRQSHADQFRKAGIPVLAVYGNHTYGIPSINDDLRSGYYHLTRHLQEIEHRRFVLLTEFPESSERVAGFELAMKGIGAIPRMTVDEFLSQWPTLSDQTPSQSCAMIVSVDRQESGKNLSEIFYRFGKRLFSNRSLPDVCLCSNDQKAFGVFAAALEMGISIPGEMALTGTDNDHFGSFPAFGLTTVRLDVKRACATAVEHLASLIRKENSPVEMTFQPSLILRTSCGRNIAPGGCPEEERVVPPFTVSNTKPYNP